MPWHVEGLDLATHDEYTLAGRFTTEADAQEAARRTLDELDRLNITDQIYVVHPGGQKYRVTR